MKKKSLKILKTALFTYKRSGTSRKGTGETDPTTTMITSTVSGIFQAGQQK
jgi:hypothetical protein